MRACQKQRRAAAATINLETVVPDPEQPESLRPVAMGEQPAAHRPAGVARRGKRVQEEVGLVINADIGGEVTPAVERRRVRQLEYGNVVLKPVSERRAPAVGDDLNLEFRLPIEKRKVDMELSFGAGLGKF